MLGMIALSLLDHKGWKRWIPAFARMTRSWSVARKYDHLPHNNSRLVRPLQRRCFRDGIDVAQALIASPRERTAAPYTSLRRQRRRSSTHSTTGGTHACRCYRPGTDQAGVAKQAPCTLTFTGGTLRCQSYWQGSGRGSVRRSLCRKLWCSRRAGNPKSRRHLLESC